VTEESAEVLGVGGQPCLRISPRAGGGARCPIKAARCLASDSEGWKHRDEGENMEKLYSGK
jgi:hypothetical protein